MRTQHEVFGDRQPRKEPVGDPTPHRFGGYVAPAEQDAAAGRAATARQRFGELALAVAGDAGHADDLARCDTERAAADNRLSTLAAHREIADLEHDVRAAPLTARRGRRRDGARPLEALADHQLDQAVLVLRAAGQRGHATAAAHDRDPIAVGENLT